MPRSRQTCEQLLGLRLDALGAVEHHHRAVHRHQRAVGVFAEILVAGRIEQVDARALVIELEHGGRDRDPALPARAPSSRTWPDAGCDRAWTDPARCTAPAIQQQFLGQRRLAGVRVRNDGKGSPAKHLSWQYFGGRLFNRQGHGRPPPTSERSTLSSISRRTDGQRGGGAARLPEQGVMPARSALRGGRFQQEGGGRNPGVFLARRTRTN